MKKVKSHITILLLIIVFLNGYLTESAYCIISVIAEDTTTTRVDNNAEAYRPLYHLSSKDGRIGDPNGTIRYRDTYHLFGWREHFVSSDLIHWEERSSPMHGDDGTFSYFSGSVVVDTTNTSGFGTDEQPAMIAIYTMHHREHSQTPDREEQAISVSLDHVQFDFWEGNPVIPSEEQFFRDPQVFWDEENERWAMVVVKPDDKIIEVYSSYDLKTWNYQSDFGPLGAQRAFWEVPDLFQLPLDGNEDKQKWVMICGVGPNTIQYWVGDFDGITFTADETTLTYLKDGGGLPGEIFEDFEDYTFLNWQIEGSVFEEPTGSEDIKGYLGNKMALSSDNDKTQTGKLISSTFTIEKPFVNFLLAGSESDSTGIQIWVNGELKKTRTGIGSSHLVWNGIDVSHWVGEQAHIEIFDEGKNQWIAVDHIMFSDILNDTGREHAYWIDWGEDFYAARTFRDYDNVEERTVWIAWLGNWTYARNLPTSWGGSAQSIPREIKLVTNETTGYDLIQKPVSELKKLRGNQFSMNQQEINGRVKIDDFKPDKNSYEIKATFELEPDKKQNFGLHLATGENNKIIVGFDEETSNIYLDRTQSGNVDFHSEFPTISKAPMEIKEGKITFHIYIDQLSVEVFVNDGKYVLTSKIFPDAHNTEIELFSKNGVTILDKMQVWELNAISQ